MVMDDGKIAEMGTHTALLRRSGHYYRLYTQQFRMQLEQEYGSPLDQYAAAL